MNKNWVENLVEQLNQCRELTIIDMQNKTPFELLGATTSELGELAQELCTEHASFGNRHRNVDEGSKVEAIDLAICALAMYFARGGTFDELPAIMERKLKKWEENQCYDSGSD